MHRERGGDLAAAEGLLRDHECGVHRRREDVQVPHRRLRILTARCKGMKCQRDETIQLDLVMRDGEQLVFVEDIGDATAHPGGEIAAGLAQNRFLAKTASEYKKPDGLTAIAPDKEWEFLEQLKSRNLHLNVELEDWLDATDLPSS